MNRHQFLREVDRALIKWALGEARGRVSLAARILGCNRTDMYKHAQKHGFYSLRYGVVTDSEEDRYKRLSVDGSREVQTLLAQLGRTVQLSVHEDNSDPSVYAYHLKSSGLIDADIRNL